MNSWIVDYVWIDSNNRCRSKTRVLYRDNLQTENLSLKDIPDWNYDGSSTGQSKGTMSEIILKPRRLFDSAFYQDNHSIHPFHFAYLVLCDTWNTDNTPALNNNRYSAQEIFSRYNNEKPWFGLEQEFFIYDNRTQKPIKSFEIDNTGSYYCGVGRSIEARGRKLINKHLFYCLKSGIRISGTNAEVSPGQWEYQIGPVEGIEASDQLWMSRYILERLAEEFDFYINYHPKPELGDWNGSGCHINFSTETMRKSNGFDSIIQSMYKLESKHQEHMAVYGEYNDQRMTSDHETSSFDSFSYGVGNRQASVRIPFDTQRNRCGYFEDRRPAANIDPYLATSKILETVML